MITTFLAILTCINQFPSWLVVFDDNDGQREVLSLPLAEIKEFWSLALPHITRYRPKMITIMAPRTLYIYMALHNLQSSFIHNNVLHV